MFMTETSVKQVTEVQTIFVVANNTSELLPLSNYMFLQISVKCTVVCGVYHILTCI